MLDEGSHAADVLTPSGADVRAAPVGGTLRSGRQRTPGTARTPSTLGIEEGMWMATTSSGHVPTSPGSADETPSHDRGPDRLAAAATAFATLAVLVQVRTWSPLGNGDYYLRNAADIAVGEMPESRYSPGFSLVLAPLAALWRDDFATLTVASGLLTGVLSAIGLALLYKWLRLHLAPWMAALVFSCFALGQASAAFLNRGEVEPLALCLVTGVLLACCRERWWLAVVLTAATVLVRVPLGPFLAVLWVLQLRARPRTTVVAGAVLGAGLVAHLAVGPRTDQSYAEIGGAIYGVGSTPAQSLVGRVLMEVGDRLGDYVLVGVPRLIWPFAVLTSPVGWLIAGVTTAAVLTGVVLLVRRPRMPATEPTAHGVERPAQVTAARAAIAFMAFVGLLLLWPVRDGETTRMVVPVVAVPLLAMAVSARWTQTRFGLPTPVVAVLLAPLLILGVASVVSLVAQRWDQPREQRDFAAAHREARDLLPEGSLVSAKPAYSELVLGVPGIGYPTGARPEGMAAFADRADACAFVIDAVNGPFDEDLADWVRSHSRDVVAEVGETAILAYDVPRCR